MDGNKKEIAQWVRRLQSGDMEAFNSLYAATNDSGYFTALKILKDPDEAQDVLQESYIAVLEKIGDLQSPETFVSWFHQIVANRAKNALVKKKPALFQTQEQAYTDFVPDADEAFQPQASVDQADLRDQVMQIVDGLSDDKRACVLLFYYNELSIADIAATMEVPENTVKTRLFQARKDIRKGVEALQKKNVCLRSAAPVSLVIWALRMAQKSEGGAFSAGPAAALVLQEVTAASAGTAAAGAAGTAATAGTFVAKLTAMTAAQKVIAGVVAAGIVTGAAAGTTAVVRNREPPAEPAAQAVVSMTEPAATVPQTWETVQDIALTETQTVQMETVTETAATSRREETQTTTVSQTAAKGTATAAGSTTVRVTGFTVPSTASTTKAQTSATTAPTTTQRATTTTQKASETTTTAPTANTPALTPAPTTTTTTAPTTTTTKPKGMATVTVQYSVADYGDSGAVTFTVEEGSAITTDMVIAAVRSKLEPTYGSGIEVFLRSGSAVAAAEPTTYSYEVMVLEE